MASSQLLPPEILDHVIDFLHDDKETLKSCCRVSKSLIPRTRGYLFSRVEFSDEDYVKWRRVFPDSTDSPGHHALTLVINGTLSGVRECSWIEDFSNVERLFILLTPNPTPPDRFLPFHELSSSLKSLHVSPHIPHVPIYHLIYSLSMLENLTLGNMTGSNGKPRSIAPSTLSDSIGTLEAVVGSVSPLLSLLPSLPRGLRFRKLRLWAGTWEKECRVVEDLIAACADTLEHLDIACGIAYDSAGGPRNLSKAMNLKEVVFRCDSLNSSWVAMWLKTIALEPRGIRRISICIPVDLGYADAFGRSFYERLIGVGNPGTRWRDVDSLLVQLREVHAIPASILYPRSSRSGVRNTRDWVKFLFPEVTRRGIAELIEDPSTA